MRRRWDLVARDLGPGEVGVLAVDRDADNYNKDLGKLL